jgi:dihydroorotate dehydrogenase electron transfer subunit
MPSPLHAAYYADRATWATTSILQNVQIARDTYRVRFECPDIAERIFPGQFLMLRLYDCYDPLLGRPLALYDTVLSSHGKPTGIDVVYLVSGKFTRRLADCGPGQLLDVWGPLGNGFPPLAAEHLIIVAGGIGQTPFLALAAEHAGQKRYGQPARDVTRPQRMTLCYGARSKNYLAGLDDFRRCGLDIRLSTDDGSEGHHGFVTDVLRRVLEEEGIRGEGRGTSDSSQQPTTDHGPRTTVVCCGPEPMMNAVAEIARQYAVPCQVSLETPMACGIGICFTCVAKVRQPDGGWDYKRTCVEGPVFDAEQIVW